MNRRSFILTILATGFFIANATLAPDLGTAQTDKLKTAMADLKARAEKIGAPKVEGKDLYFGSTKVDNSVVDAVAKEHGGAATIFVNLATLRASLPRQWRMVPVLLVPPQT
jgi:hypothetical protein